MSNPNQQQNGRANETESINLVDSAERAIASPAVPAAAGHNNGSNSMTAQAAGGVAAPRLHVLISEDGRAPSETQSSYGPAGVDSNNPALAAHASQKHSGPTAILGHDAQSQFMHSNEMPAQMNRGASPAPGNPSLAAPQAVPYSMQGHAGPGGLHPHVIEGRISPRPVSRNQSRGSNYHGQQLFNPDAHHRAPGDTRTQLFVGNLPFRVRWQDLKDLFRKCGSVLRSDVALTLDNRSKGFGTVLYANEDDARNAIETFNGYTWQSRVLDVRIDQQDPTGAISLANAAAQQAQQHAYQTHQQAMQNMANMVGVAQNAAAAALYHQGYPMFGGAGPAASSPWMAAAMANNFRQAGFAPPAHGPSPVPPSGGPAGPFAIPGRAASPYKPVQLGNDLANMSLRRNSASTEGSSIPQSGSSSSLGPPRGRGDSLPHNQVSPAGSSSRPGTSSASPTPGVGAQEQKTASPSPAATVGDSQSISPTSARRPPPGSLGPMPPSIFASMPQNAQLPNPPAAAAAAVAAGYALDKESAGSSRHTTSPYSNSGPTSRRGSSTLHDGTVHPGNQVRQQQGINLDSDTSISLLAGAENGQMQVPGNFAGGLASFYQQQQRGGGQNHSQAGMYGSGRSSPAPAFADRQLFVGNIPFNCQWQDLKDLFRAAGQIQRADVSLGPDGRSRGFGRVVFATPEDAMNAMQMFNGYEFQGRPLKVHFDKFAPGGSPFGQHAILSMPQYNGGPGAVYNGVYQSQFIQPSNAQNNQQADSGFQSVNRPSALQPLYGYAQNGQAWSQVGGGSFDDNSSVPGTPIHEMNLAQIAAFPSPGFASPMQQVQQQGQTAEMRRRGINAEGVPVAPIGSGAPHTQHDNRSLIQSGHGIPLSPLTIPPMSMAMPSPGPGGLFSPPLPGMGPMMTPSMPGFSFHPFPQTPPLLPQFLSPGLGPFSPPLGTPGTFFGYNGPSSLRNSAPGDNDATPLQSPNTSHGYDQQSNYFPPLPDQPHAATRPAAKQEASSVNISAAPVSGTSSDTDRTPSAPEEVQETTTPTLAQASPTNASDDAPVDDKRDSDSDLAAPTNGARRASFKEQKTNFLLGVPPTNGNRGGSLDIPRPNLQLGEISSDAKNASAVDDDDATPPPTGPIVSEAPLPSPSTTQTKKSAWNLSWLKKQ